MAIEAGRSAGIDDGRETHGEIREAAVFPIHVEVGDGETAQAVLWRHGGAAVPETKLIALLLDARREAPNREARAADLLAQRDGLAGLLATDPRVLRFLGLSGPEATRLAVASELCRRLFREQVPEEQPLSKPRAVADYLVLRYGGLQQEALGALFLDIRQRLLAIREIFRGGLSRTTVEPGPILREAILLGASRIVLFHNHPSGDPSPSAEDILFTKALAEAGKVVGVSLLDHLVLGDLGRWISLSERRPELFADRGEADKRA